MVTFQHFSLHDQQSKKVHAAGGYGRATVPLVPVLQIRALVAVGKSAGHEVPGGLKHRVGGAGDEVIVQTLDVAQEVERRRLRRGAIATVAKPRKVGFDRIGLPAPEFFFLLRQNSGGMAVPVTNTDAAERRLPRTA